MWAGRRSLLYHKTSLILIPQISNPYYFNITMSLPIVYTKRPMIVSHGFSNVMRFDIVYDKCVPAITRPPEHISIVM